MKTKKQAELPALMRVAAALRGFPPTHQFCKAAEELSKACELYYKQEPEITVFKFASVYQEARRLWLEHIGEALVDGLEKRDESEVLKELEQFKDKLLSMCDGHPSMAQRKIISSINRQIGVIKRDGK